MKAISLCLCAVALTGCAQLQSAYDNYPGGTYSYRTKDGRLVTVTVSDKAKPDNK